MIRYGSYRVFQRYLCKDCDRTFNDQTSTVFESFAVALRKWFLALYTYIRSNTSLRQLDVEIDVSYKTIYRRVQRFLQALDAPRLQVENPVEIDEFYVKAVLKGRERDQPSRSRGLSTRGRGTYTEDKLPVFFLADRGSSERYVVPVKAATESKIRLLLAVDQQESLTTYTDGFRAYEPLEEDDVFTGECVVHGDDEYVDGNVHANTCESHASLARRWFSPHRGVSKDRLIPYSERFSFAVNCSANRVRKRSKPSSKLRYDSPTIPATRAK